MPSTGSNSSVSQTAAAVAPADVVVALTSHNNAVTIGPATRAIVDGLGRYCPGLDARLLLADAGSTDGTREAAREAAGTATLVEMAFEHGRELGEMPYHGQHSRAAVLRAVLTAARQSGAKACAVVDAGVETLAPIWIERLVAPVVAGECDYVSPYYSRHVGEGALTRGLVYPAFRALYGARLRQPAAIEFGCSAGLVAHYLEDDLWDADHAAAGIDLRLATSAVAGGFRIWEAALGVRRAGPRAASTDLSTTIAQVVGTLFTDLETRVDVWQRVRGSSPVPVAGDAPAIETAAPHVGVEALADAFRLGYRELRDIWTWLLPARAIVDLRRLTETPTDRFRLDDHLWAEIVYDFAIGHALRVMPRDHLLRSLTPLYSGWLAGFARELGDAADSRRIDETVERLCLAFEAEKRYLIARWRWPERLR